MSRIGKIPVKIPKDVTVKHEGAYVIVSKGKISLKTEIKKGFKVNIGEGEVTIERPSDQKEDKALHGLYRSLINNNVIGLTDGYVKNLEIQGTGFRAAKQGKKLVLNLGYSHTIEMQEPEGVQIEVPANDKIVVKGADKQLVGETAAKIRSFRVPDAYHGKGIRYQGEYVRIKEGKTGAKAK